MYSVVVSLIPRRPSVGSEVGRELEAYKLAVVRDGVSYSGRFSTKYMPSIRPACLLTTNQLKYRLCSYSMAIIGLGENSRRSYSTRTTRSCYIMTFSNFPRAQ